MGVLRDFRTMDLMEQIGILAKIEQGKRHEAIAELFDLYRTPLKDDAVDHMIEVTLKGLLSGNAAETVSRLLSGDVRERRLCIEVAGRNRFESATPALLDLASSEADGPMLVEILGALAQIRAPESLLVFRRHMHDPDPFVSSLCIDMIGAYGDMDSQGDLCKIVEESDSDERYETCDLPTAEAVDALASLPGEAALSFLVSKIDHRNPTARRLIHQAVAAAGARALPLLGGVFDQGNVDKKICCANILGLIGDRRCADILASAIDKGAARDPNVRFAIYESLGEMDSLKAMVCLLDGLSEEDELLLTAVISSLDRKVNPGVISKVQGLIGSEGDQGERVVRTIVSTRALNIFEGLYGDEKGADRVIEAASKTNDDTILSRFRFKLDAIGGDRAKSYVERLLRQPSGGGGKRVLAVDDSKAMLAFYASLASDSGLHITTATNGKEAFGLLEGGEAFDLIVTDMNMPVMDGVEFTGRVRANPFWADIPILMITTESKASQVQLAKKAGVTDFLNKPFTKDVLLAKAEQLL